MYEKRTKELIGCMNFSLRIPTNPFVPRMFWNVVQGFEGRQNHNTKNGRNQLQYQYLRCLCQSILRENYCWYLLTHWKHWWKYIIDESSIKVVFSTQTGSLTPRRRYCAWYMCLCWLQVGLLAAYKEFRRREEGTTVRAKTNKNKDAVLLQKREQCMFMCPTSEGFWFGEHTHLLALSVADQWNKICELAKPIWIRTCFLRDANGMPHMYTTNKNLLRIHFSTTKIYAKKRTPHEMIIFVTLASMKGQIKTFDDATTNKTIWLNKTF